MIGKKKVRVEFFWKIQSFGLHLSEHRKRSTIFSGTPLGRGTFCFLDYKGL